jgi:predicted MFS family arabinose efflux permease
MPLSRYERKRSLVGVIAAMAVVNLVYGITFPLLALVLDSQGVSKTLIGLNTVVQAFAVIVIAPWTPELMRRIAPSRLMQAMTVLLAALFIVAGLFPNVWFWFPLRFLIGALTALLWISSEALINDLAEERWRGRIIGLYASIGAAGFALGPLLLILTGSAGMLPFIATSSLILCAGIPLFIVHQRQMSRHEEQHGGLRRVFWLAPAIMLANVAYAASAESLMTFFPIFGIGLGLGENFTLGLMTVMGFGAMILVMPLSWLADHTDRMGMLAVCVLLTLLGLLLMPSLIREGWLAGVYAFVFGGVEGMIYTLGVILVGERFKVLGPLVVGLGMDWLGDERMALIIAALFAVYLPLPVISWYRGRKVPGVLNDPLQDETDEH